MAKEPRVSYDTVADAITASTPATSGKMFGMPSMFINRKAFAGLVNSGAMVFKLGGDAHAKALAIPGAHLFEPMPGRPMKEWVEVPVDQASQWERLARAALEYVSQSAK